MNKQIYIVNIEVGEQYHEFDIVPLRAFSSKEKAEQYQTQVDIAIEDQGFNTRFSKQYSLLLDGKSYRIPLGSVETSISCIELIED